VHNVLEHDASLRLVLQFGLPLSISPSQQKFHLLTYGHSRTDAFFGNNHVFNQTIFNQTRVYWTSETLDANMLPNGKIARQIESKAFNPNYTFTSNTEQFSLGEVAAPVIAFGDMENVQVNRTLVEYFFRALICPTPLSSSLP
jgi:hypothetical protein